MEEKIKSHNHAQTIQTNMLKEQIAKLGLDLQEET